MLKNLLELHINIDEIIEDFVNEFLYSNSNIEEDHFNIVKNIFIDIIRDILSNSDSLEKNCVKLSKLNILNDIPLVVLMSELNYLKKSFLTIFVHNSAVNEMLLLHEIYFKIEKYVAKEYFEVYLVKLSKSNIVRINSLKNLTEIDLVKYYEKHITWLNSLVEAAQYLDNNKLPELDSNLCSFGYWLLNNAQNIIKTDLEYTNLVNRHERLHNIATLIEKKLNKNENEIDYHILMTYIESCELISLSIGTELALLDNSNMIRKTEKDEVSGAIKGDFLNMLFKNQYEISLATNSSFILAVCELDNFQDIHAMDGNTSSDILLKTFVLSAKSILRSSDIIMRYDREKFIIILLNSDFEVANDKFTQLKEDLENTSLNYKENIFNTTVSIGYIEIKPPNDIAHSSMNVMDYVNAAERKLLEEQISAKSKNSLKM